MSMFRVRASALVTTLVCLGLVPACVADDGDDVGSTAEALGAMDKGAGAGPALFDEDPCEHPREFAKAHRYNLIEAAAGQHDIKGTGGRDLIVGTGGDDVIHAGGGEDIVCAGGGEDEVYGEGGNDYIDGGSDNDKIFGGPGNDLVHGRGGGDDIHGGPGDDLLFGDILDDHVYGDEGDDLLIGGHGTDHLDGGPGSDYLRGDTGTDVFIGGPADDKGHDVASFATAMPPGQPNIEGHPNPFDGVRVDFSDEGNNHCTIANEPRKPQGCADGDGGNEPLLDIEIVVGSPYADHFVSGGRDVRFVGGWGADVCVTGGASKPCGEALPDGASGKIFVSLDTTKARDVGLIVRGTTRSDRLDIVRQGDDLVVRSPLGQAVFAGPGCSGTGSVATCSSKHVIRFIAAWMDDGNDVVKLAQAAADERRFPLDMTAHVSGGDGDDFLHGGSEEDVLFSGPTGEDHLFGNDGDDALLSESRRWPAKDCSEKTQAQKDADPRCTEDKPSASDYKDGADELVAGAGDDQLVADYPCGGHHYSGGGGKDVAGFARSGSFALHAQLAGAASKPQDFHGRAFNPELCDKSHGTKFDDDLEILEASDGDDELWGNDQPNIIWGREGNDRIHGLGGDDELAGLKGDDKLYGGAGNDKLEPGEGHDEVFQDAD